MKDHSKPQVNGNILAVISPAATLEELTQINDAHNSESNGRTVIFRNTKELANVTNKLNKSGLWTAKIYNYINWRGTVVKAEIIPDLTNIMDESIRKEILEFSMGYKYNALPAPSPVQRKTLTLNFDLNTHKSR